MVRIVVAYGRNHVIGIDGGLPWHLPTDMKHFREVTAGGTVIMGRHTWDSIPEKFRPLPGRRNLVLSRNPDFEAPDAVVLPTLATALAAADGDAYVIGGGATYREALPFADEVWATEIDAAPDGDTHFPELVPADWRIAEERDPVSENGFTFTIRLYARNG